MLEIFAITILWKVIGKLLRPVNKNPIGYQIMMVLIWISFELVSSVFARIEFQSQLGPNTIELFLVAYGFALFGAVIGGSFSYFFVKAIAEKKYPGLVVIAAIYVILSFGRIFTLFHLLSESEFLNYADLPTYHLLITYIIGIIFRPIISYGLITNNYRLGFLLGISITSLLAMNTIVLWSLSKSYGIETSITTIFFPLIVVILLLTRYKNAFTRDIPLEINMLDSTEKV